LLKNKKAQITLYIILGFVLLAGIAVFFYVRSTVVEEGIAAAIPTIEEAPSELMPLKEYTENCIYTLAEKALYTMGTQGGYISLEEAGIRTSMENPTEADGIQFAPDSDLKVPYWWYMKASNDCTRCIFSSFKPDLQRTTGTRADFSVEAQLDRYIEANLKTCLDDYNPFREQGYEITYKGDLKTRTGVNELDIGVYVEYPIEVKVAEQTFEFGKYYVTLPLNIKKIYEFGTEIVNAELSYTYLENQALNLITSFSKLQQDRLPPKAETTFKFGGGVVWATENVKKNIEEMLQIYIGAIQVPFTNNFRRKSFSGDMIQENIYSMYAPANLDRNFTSLGARFDYLAWWPIYFDAGQGGLIKPESMNALFLPIGVQRYDITYDISYPVLVTINDPDAFNGKGYIFMFAVEANIRNNEAIDEKFTGLQGLSAFQPTLLCNENQKNSGNITLYAKNGYDGKPVENAQISYTCGTDSCFMGATDTDGMLKSKFPVCSKGILTVMRTDYFAPAQYLEAKLDESQTAPETRMWPYAEKQIEIRKWLYSPEFNTFSANPLNLGMKEEAVVMLKRVKDSAGEEEVYAVADFFGNESYTANHTVRLVPGTYEVTVSLINHESLYIPPEKRKANVGFIGELTGIKSDYTVPEIKIDNAYVSGGAELSESTGYFVLKQSELYSPKTLRILAIGLPVPKNIEGVELMGQVNEFSSKNRAMLQPVYVEARP
jgi:hypothetical protein